MRNHALMRYERQIILPVIGEEGQSRIASARVAVFGTGAIGAVSAAVLCRAGVGFLRLVDRDYVSESNLSRGELFTESDAIVCKPKAIACAEHLLEINQHLRAEPVIVDINAKNIEDLIADVDVVLDGADNFELRYLINDACHKLQKPWIHGSVQGTAGAFMTVLPEGPCLRCLNPQVPEPGLHPTCVTEGLLGATTKIIAAQQAIEALKLILGSGEVLRGYHHIDCWYAEIDDVEVPKNPQCRCCSLGIYDYL